MYPVSKTRGIILKSRPSGEASRLFFVLTDEFGLILLRGQSIRALESKLRFHLTDYSLVELELIRGRDFWRPVSISRNERFAKNLPAIAKISTLVLRLIDLEEKNTALFLDLRQGFGLLQKEELDGEVIEAVTVLRVLARLGYVGEGSLLDFVNSTFSPDLLPAARQRIGFVINNINETLRTVL